MKAAERREFQALTEKNASRWGEGDFAGGNLDSAERERLAKLTVKRQAEQVALQAERELAARAFAAGVEPEDLQAADRAIAAELEARSQLPGPVDHYTGQPQGGANDPTYREIVDFVDDHQHSTPGFAFVAAVSFAAGKAARS